MGRIVQPRGKQINIEMSPEFQAQLNVSLIKLLGFVDVTLRAGRIWKSVDGTWGCVALHPDLLAFEGGWDTFDTSRVLGGDDDDEIVRVYFASARHTALRSGGFRQLVKS